VQYSGLLTPEGTFVDDCTVYRFDDKLMIVVNAANTAKAWEHIVAHKGGINVRRFGGRLGARLDVYVFGRVLSKTVRSAEGRYNQDRYPY